MFESIGLKGVALGKRSERVFTRWADLGPRRLDRF